MDLIAPCVCFDRGNHTCIVVRVTDRKIFVIPMTAEGLDLVAWPVSKFRETRSERTGEILPPDWHPDPYPVGRAAARYLASGDIIPISKAARQQLELLTSPLDVEPSLVRASAIAFVNTARRRASRQPLATAPEVYQPAKENDDMTAKKPAAKKSAMPKGVKEVSKMVGEKPAGRKPGVTAFIKECLLKGMDSEEICMEISTKFPASKAGKPEIAWCKGQLKKEGVL